MNVLFIRGSHNFIYHFIILMSEMSETSKDLVKVPGYLDQEFEHGTFLLRSSTDTHV
jgi:hypothetical protein